MNKLNFNCYALIQRGYAIFGVGSTPAAAIRDAKKWLNGGEINYGDFIGDMALVPCTAKLMRYVKKNGGDIPWSSRGRADNGICLPDELI